MSNLQPDSREHQSLEAEDVFQHPIVPMIAVSSVADDRMCDVFAVSTQLMPASRQRVQAQ